jgi:hypothetical protein
MPPTAVRPLVRPLATLSIVASTVLLIACASTRITTGHAQGLAVANVCASPPADTSCTVRNTRRVGSGYVVTIDRRPPSGNDQVHVSVSSGGVTTVIPARDTTKNVP